MTKLNRRQFLKLSGAALVASALPLSLLAAEPIKPSLVMRGMKPGKYLLSFTWRDLGSDARARYFRDVEILEGMDLNVILPGRSGDLSDIMLEKDKKSNLRFHAGFSRNEYLHSGTVTRFVNWKNK